MKLFYVANIRIPTEKAHGVAIVKACESFARAGVETTLVVPRRRTPFEKDVFETYSVEPLFAVRFLPVIDLIRERAGRFVFALETATFYISAYAYLLFKGRDVLIYTREPGFIALSRLGFRVVLECHLIPKRRMPFFKRARRASRIIVISEALRRAFIDAGFDPKTILVTPSGVDLSIFDTAISRDEARKKLGFPEGVLIVAYTGNFTTMGEDKGLGDAITALGKAPDALLVAVGGSDRDRARYVAEAREAGVEDRVRLIGYEPQATLALYQKAADVLLMPFPDLPHYRDHMSPVKMFEYMAAKRPIIASDLPTIREVLDDETAIIIPPGDTEALASAIKKIIADPDAARMLAERAYQKVSSKYTWQKRTERILEHIDGAHASHNRDMFSVRANVFDKEYWRADEEEASKFLNPGKLLVGGVGAGRTLPSLVKKGFDITAVDISPVMVEKTKEKFPGLDVRMMDIQHTDFPDAAFDSIFLPFHTICYVEDIELTLRELHRILKPGGTLVFTMVNRFYIHTILSGRVFEPKRAQRHIMPGSNEMLWTVQATPWDVVRFRRIFKRVHLSGRVRLQHLSSPNWKDRILAMLPFLDKSVYFFCTKGV
ncbi:hypothetical protein A3A38_00335 [Candidatus Kaiserbacteria bacterium RIFCSPLOWO2_01_FULL_53_17]|uniref:Methyltransferase type 11 domain-containing protein n=1 Tax=Candidatus Kaiserbacteria bacterium RIFCSPLOWO2_01_FULL_53_17 TaxID=1798511 RepID=A0A1F6EGB4_9BACT|nr:MAG: hypothetical protein A3A38_00335 [Candidatus Kaiserbacteria bacterium RIFCSPLOWO2_01_FULL_53_17]